MSGLRGSDCVGDLRWVAAMMGLVKLSAGDGYTYLIRQVAALDATGRGRSSLEEYYSAKGESPGRWLGRGLDGLGLAVGIAVTEAHMRHLFGSGHHPVTGEPLGRAFKVYPSQDGYRSQVAGAYRQFNADRGEPEGAPIAEQDRAGLKSQVARRLFAQRHGRAPLDARELSGFVAQESRRPKAAVSGFDLTFSPVKSVSVLWALAEPTVAREIEVAHQAAVKDTLAWVERQVAFTRTGVGGVRQVAVRGLVAAVFTHRDSRSGDPDLHTHVAVSNKVQTLREDGGRWLALDGRVLFKAKVAASERYNTRLEAELVDRLGVRFVERRTAAGRRPVREIDGVDESLARRWSMRRAAIDARREELARQFLADHGRTPTPTEALALGQQATLETREAKHEPVSEAEQRSRWRGEASEWLGKNASTMVASALHRAAPAGAVDVAVGVAAVAEQVVSVVAESRATWQVWHVRAEAERQARAANVALSQLDEVVNQVVDHALRVCSRRLDPADPIAEPAALRRPDGASLYAVAGSATYTSQAVMAAEEKILAAAQRTDGWRVPDAAAAGIVTRMREELVELSTEQTELVRSLATSGRRVELALAPAGSGKTTAMRALARVVGAAGGNVVGLAPSAAAAQELARATGLQTDTLAKLAHTVERVPTEEWPSWMRQIGPRSLLLVDEAGMAATAELAVAVSFAVARGASVRLVGDDHQLTSVAAGGVLRDLDHHVGAVRLSHLHRFTDPAEAAATLALRAGDVGALGFYADRGRIHVGDLASAVEQSFDAWRADVAAGRDALLLAPTREVVRQLNERARTDRLTAAGEVGRDVALGDGTHASRGDLIITRRNERRLGYGRGNWVRNGDRWRVVEVRADGSMLARSLRGGGLRDLPAAYVADHIQLGYACTVHTAQGLTADTCHVVATGSESREVLYVGLSRGRAANHVYLGAASDGDPHTVLDPETLSPATAVEVLARVLTRDESQRSAHTADRELTDPARRLQDAAARYHDALSFAATQILGQGWQQNLNQMAEQMLPGLTTSPSYPHLACHLALRELDDLDALSDLREVVGWGDFDAVRDPAAVLDYRLGPHVRGGPLPTLPGIPQRLATSEWGDYLHQRAQLVASLSVTSAAPATPPTAAAGRGNWLDRVPPGVRHDPRCSDLTERLAELAKARRDVPQLLEQAVADGPLPTEVPADALWWRVAGRAASTREPPPVPALARAALRPPPAQAPSRRPEQMTPHRRTNRGYGPAR